MGGDGPRAPTSATAGDGIAAPPELSIDRGPLLLVVVPGGRFPTEVPPRLEGGENLWGGTTSPADRIFSGESEVNTSSIRSVPRRFVPLKEVPGDGGVLKEEPESSVCFEDVPFDILGDNPQVGGGGEEGGKTTFCVFQKTRIYGSAIFAGSTTSALLREGALGIP